MISRLEIKFGKEFSTFQAIDQFIYSWKRIPILHQNLVEFHVVNAHVPSPIFRRNKDKWTSKRRGDGSYMDLLDQILDMSMNLFILDNGSLVDRFIS